jgi:pimeloyl-ACP methyl ester carboxylesterase
LTDNGLCWSRLARALEDDFDIVMLDARGHGTSSRLPDGAHFNAGRDIAEAVEALGLRTPIVMGHSIGALATATFAADYPHLVSRVILEDPPFVPASDLSSRMGRKEKFRLQVLRLQSMSDAEITQMGKEATPDWHDDEFPAWTLAKRQVDPDAMPVAFPLWQAVIEKILVPTLLVYGEQARGGLVTPQVAAEAMRVNPRVQSVEVQQAGHNIRRENFAAYLAVIRNFLLENKETEIVGG